MMKTTLDHGHANPQDITGRATQSIMEQETVPQESQEHLRWLLRLNTNRLNGES
jgi:hypothetical protein